MGCLDDEQDESGCIWNLENSDDSGDLAGTNRVLSTPSGDTALGVVREDGIDRSTLYAWGVSFSMRRVASTRLATEFVSRASSIEVWIVLWPGMRYGHRRRE